MDVQAPAALEPTRDSSREPREARVERATAATSSFNEATARKVPIRELGLTIAGTNLEPLIAAFEKEVEGVGIHMVHPRFYLSTEWGVPYQTIAIGIPFYLARPELTLLQEEQTCHVEGSGSKDILRYLRHEMGHVVNYAYRLYESKEWIDRFGSMNKPYEEEYRPRPFSREFVHHLPGWYAQKHPDEDWSETFAVWMTPGLDWRVEYAKWPGALRKLEFCDRVMAGSLSMTSAMVRSQNSSFRSAPGHLPYCVRQSRPGVSHTAKVSAQSSSGCFWAYQPGRWWTNSRLKGRGRYSSS